MGGEGHAHQVERKSAIHLGMSEKRRTFVTKSFKMKEKNYIR